MADRNELLRRQQALANFGDFVLDHEDLDAILEESCRLIAQALDVDLAKVIEIERDAHTGLVRAGTGWSPGVVGHARIPMDGKSSEAFAIEQSQPVISNDIAAEERFEFAQFLRDHGVVALVNVPIMLPRRRPWGLLQVDARVRRDVDQEDIEFLKTYAMVLGPVVDRFLIANERDAARERLSHREERLLRVLDGMGEAFGVLGPDFTILEHNREALHLADRSREAVVGRKHWDVYPGSENSKVGELLRRAMDERVPVMLEHEYPLRPGAANWLEMRVYPTSDGDLAVFWRDITAQRAAADALRASEHRYRTLFESMDEAYAVVEVLRDAAGDWSDFRFVDANPAFMRHTDLPDPVGKTATELLGSPNPRWARLYGQVLDTQEPLRIEESEPTLGRTFDLNIFSLDRQHDRIAVLFTDITQRQRATDALRESEARLAAAFDSVPVGIAVIDMPGRVVFSNALYHRFLPTGMMPSRDPERVWRWRGWNSKGCLLEPEQFPGARTLRGESVVPGQEMLFTDDTGQEIWTSVAAVPTRDATGEVTGMVSVIGDIDAEKRSLIALRESEERLRQFGEASQDVLWIRDAQSLQWQYLSPAFETVYGLSREAALAGDNYRNWQDLIVPDDRARAIDNIARVALGEQVVFEYRIRRPDDGQIRWLRNTDFPMGGDDGTVPRIGGVGHDITALKRTEEALAAAKQRQRLLLEGMPQLVWRAVDDGQWRWASPQWIEYTGLSDEASRGPGWLEALHPDDREMALAAWARASIEGIFQVEYRIRNVRSGLHRWFQTRGMPIRGADGSVVEWLGTSTDIDEQVSAREYLRQTGEELEQRVAERTAELQDALNTLHHEAREREQAEERLRQSEKLKAVGQLTGGIAHDFNNMLQGITSALGLVQSRLAQGRLEAAQAYIEPAQKAAERAGALTQRLLAFSRQQTLSPRLVSLNQVAFDMEDMIRRAVGPAVQVELKSIDGHWQVMCDPNQMESALLNLCINARDAMPEGGWLTIGIEERMFESAELAGFEDLRPGHYVVLSVTDTGSGMAPEVMARAFEPFFTTKPLGQGTGLGLSQIYGFMHQSGGLVKIETAPGQGTTVRLALPAQASEAKNMPGVLKNGKTLLLAEDEHDLRRMLGDQLRDLGYGVLEADTAEAALRILHTGHQIDLLVTDVGLRGSMNGRQLAEAARTHRSALPVLFITGYPGDNLISEDHVLRKPFKPAMLALRIREQIG